MPQARKEQVCLEDTPYYHCVSRCVRRAYLCGRDQLTGQSYEHRRAWVEKRLLFLADIFAIDVCAYAVMSNHTHVVVHVNRDVARRWSAEEVIRRWHRLHRGTLLTQMFVDSNDHHDMGKAERRTLQKTVNIYRKRLCDISWFMRELNEFIARQANKEDQCTGRFWEGRFKSQALLDEAALVTCMAYVDLNPLRSGLAKSLEESRFTSVYQRIKAALSGSQPMSLAPFSGVFKTPETEALPFELKDYLDMVDLTSRNIALGKSGFVDSSINCLTERLGISPDNWAKLTSNLEQLFRGDVGRIESLENRRVRRKQSRVAGRSSARLLSLLTS